MEKVKYSVKMHFDYDEYVAFKSWYEDVCLEGLNSFVFPKIDGFGSEYAEYEFAEDSAPEYSNPSGKMIECTMEWQEV